MASAGLDLDAVMQMLVKSSGVEESDDGDESDASSESQKSTSSAQSPDPNGKGKLEIVTTLTKAGADLNASSSRDRRMSEVMSSAVKGLDLDENINVNKRMSGARHDSTDTPPLAAHCGSTTA